MDREGNTAVYIPACTCEELLKNQFGSAAHAAHSSDSPGSPHESFIVVMATHGHTAEAAEALGALGRAGSTSATALGSIVFIDEIDSEREQTEQALSGLPGVRRFLYGNGDVYWSRALRALLDEALGVGADFIIHVNTDVLVTAPIDVLLAPMRLDGRVAAVAGRLTGDVPITGYRPVHAWFPFFRMVKPGRDAAILPASYVVYRASALRSGAVDLAALDEYRHGWADVELSYQLRERGNRLATSSDVVGIVEHKRYFRRTHQFDRYGGSFLRYVLECPTAPCFADTKRIGIRLFGRFWPVMLRVYVPVGLHWVRYRLRRLKPDQ